MTVETTTTVEIGDIAEIEIECVACHTRIAWNPRSDDGFFPSKCKRCDRTFFLQDSVEQKELLQLLSIINRYSETKNFRLRFFIKQSMQAK